VQRVIGAVFKKALDARHWLRFNGFGCDHLLWRIKMRIFLGMLAAIGLCACSDVLNTVHTEQDCEPQGDLRVVCGIQAPEDLAALPDHSGLLISEYGHQGIMGGRLSLYDIATGSTRILYDLASINDLRLGQNLWGDDHCAEPEVFSPHGFDLSQRPSGRWQLLVVNHGGRDTIEMFELMKNQPSGWALEWRGCVMADGNSVLNDVAATDNGFVASEMVQVDSFFNGGLDYILGRQNGRLWRWTLQSGLQTVPDLQGVGFNGVVSDNQNKRFYVNAYGENKIKIFDRIKKLTTGEVAIEKADNTNWDSTRDGFLLVASHQANLLQMAWCVSHGQVNCNVPFSIYEVNIDTLQKKEIFHSDGEYFGGGTAAIHINHQLFIGSFAGNRLLIAPMGYGVN